MDPNIKFYKIKLLQEFNASCEFYRKILLDECIDYATDPTVYKRRIRMLEHLSIYQGQLTKKIMDFETDDINDLDIPIWKKKNNFLIPEILHVIDRSA